MALPLVDQLDELAIDVGIFANSLRGLLDNGAHALKLFPAEAASPKVVKAIRAVLPKEVRLIVVGGVDTDTIGGWLDAGADGFGLGSGVYRPGQSPAETLDKARAFVAAVRR